MTTGSLQHFTHLPTGSYGALAALIAVGAALAGLIL